VEPIHPDAHLPFTLSRLTLLSVWVVCTQDAYLQLLTFQLTTANLLQLVVQSFQQSIISEPVCRALESLLYGGDCPYPLMMHSM
jgi:hypothetical protein